MKNLFKNLKISHAILTVALVPVVVAAVFSGLMVVQEMQKVHSLSQLETLTTLSVKMSTLVHEQQKERGTTAGFLSSKGAKFRSELTAQRKLTDEKRAELQAYLKSFEAKNFDQAFNEKFSAVLSDLAKMDNIRTQVDSLSIPASTAIGYYTGLNGRNFDTISYMATLSPDPGIVVCIIGYTNFLQGKERAGIERAVGAGGFAIGRFSPASLDKFKVLIGAQNTYNSVFLTYAMPWQKTAFDEVMSSPPAK